MLLSCFREKMPACRWASFSLAAICFFHFVLRFWNHVLICTSVRQRVLESSRRFETERYLSAWKGKTNCQANYSRKVLLCFSCELRGPAWAIGSYSISQLCGGNFPKHYLQNLATDNMPHSVQSGVVGSVQAWESRCEG